MTRQKSTEEKEAYVKVYDLDRLGDKMETLSGDVKELKESIDRREEDYVTKKDLEIRLSKVDGVVKFFWWFATAVGALTVATLYQLIINSIKASQ